MVNSIKNLFNNYFRENIAFDSKHVSFRQYEPQTDLIVSSFNSEDWNEIFPGLTEDSFISWAYNNDDVFLSCIDIVKQELFGILVLIDSDEIKNGVCFHGGTWKHERRYTLLAYEGLYRVIQFLVVNEFKVLTTCNKTNLKADLLQKRFGFVEYNQDGILSYKYLDLDKFANSNIPNILERCIIKEN